MPKHETDPRDASSRPAFWDWATRAYARPAAEESLLVLQDQAGLNVNLCLWCLWAARYFEVAPDIVIRNAVAAVSEWQDAVVANLRATRRAMKAFEGQSHYEDAAALRSVVKEAELAAERIEIGVLEDIAERMLAPTTNGDAQARARRNLANYAALTGAAKQEGFSTALLHRLIDNILPEARDPSGASKERDEP